MTRRICVLGVCLLAAFGGASAQDVPVGDLVVLEQDIAYRLVGYGLVMGLDGTGDRALGDGRGGHTVRSVANVLRRVGIEVPPSALRTKNVAAVLVTAEVSAYLRPGGRFEVQVASIGDAVSLRGGVLLTTPLSTEVGGPPVATAQGTVRISDGVASIGLEYPIETSARLTDAGLLEVPLPATSFANTSRLLLKNPDLTTALDIANSVNQDVGSDMAVVEDPGSVLLSLPADAVERATRLSSIRALRVTPTRHARLIIDGRDGTVVAGGDLVVGEAVVSHAGMTLAIGAAGAPPGGNALQMTPGTTVQDVARALHGLAAPPNAIAAVFTALKDVGAIRADVSVR